MVADFIVLDRDLTKIPAPDILGTKVLRTVVAGHPTYFANAVTR
jgi:predicted amidohydrolase YtcJ